MNKKKNLLLIPSQIVFLLFPMLDCFHIDSIGRVAGRRRMMEEGSWEGSSWGIATTGVGGWLGLTKLEGTPLYMSFFKLPRRAFAFAMLILGLPFGALEVTPETVKQF